MGIRDGRKGTHPEECRDPNYWPHRAKALLAHHGKPSKANRQDHRACEDKGTARCRTPGMEGLNGRCCSDGNACLLKEDLSVKGQNKEKRKMAYHCLGPRKRGKKKE